MANNESIIGYIDGIELYGLATLQHFIAIVTSQRVIFLQIDDGLMNLIGGMGVGVIHSQMQAEKIIEKLNTSGVDQLINTKANKVIIEKNNFSNIIINEWPILFRSKIVVNQDGKKYKFKMYKSKINKFKKLLNK